MQAAPPISRLRPAVVSGEALGMLQAFELPVAALGEPLQMEGFDFQQDVPTGVFSPCLAKVFASNEVSKPPRPPAFCPSPVPVDVKLIPALSLTEAALAAFDGEISTPYNTFREPSSKIDASYVFSSWIFDGFPLQLARHADPISSDCSTCASTPLSRSPQPAHTAPANSEDFQEKDWADLFAAAWNNESDSLN
jgi:hypothetical protein